jgi:hypothetical protein
MAQRRLLALYTEKMQPSLQEQLHFRSIIWKLPAARDIQQALFWRDYDVSAEQYCHY